MSSSIETFLTNSSLVSNINRQLTYSEMKEIINNLNSPYINSKIYEINKTDCEIEREGITSAIVEADYAIAETGTVVMDSSDEKLRMATCLAEELHVILPISRIKDKLIDIATFLEEQTSNQASFVAFITGASRTADIERVLTIGVHGPCKMYVYILTDR